MSALHTVPSAAVAASAQTTAAAAPGDPAAGELSFAAVLNAQLGLPASGPLSLLTMGEDPVPEDKALAHTDPAPGADGSNAVQTLPFALPFAVQTPTAAGVPDAGDALSQHDKSVPVGKVSPASVDTMHAALPPEQPEVGASAAEPTPAPASFAAALQALPAPGPDATRHERFLKQDEVSPAPLPLATPPAASESQPAHRSAAITTALPMPVQDSRWSNAFSEKVVWITGQQVQAAEIHVEPPQLGPIEVRVSIANDQANLLFNAPHAVARDAIQMSLPRLQEMLLESGLTLGNVSVGGHNGGSQQGRDEAQRGGIRSGSDAVFGVDPAATQTALRIHGPAGLVDLFA